MTNHVLPIEGQGFCAAQLASKRSASAGQSAHVLTAIAPQTESARMHIAPDFAGMDC
jgi:hypothetical protein